MVKHSTECQGIHHSYQYVSANVCVCAQSSLCSLFLRLTIRGNELAMLALGEVYTHENEGTGFNRKVDFQPAVLRVLC